MSEQQPAAAKKSPYHVQVSSFEGPMDLLLFLIQKNEVNIYDIPISEITEQYMEFIRYASEIQLDNLTDFYVMASTLLYIKSRMLLPVEVEFDEEYEDPRKDLVQRLLEYQKYKKYADLINDQELTTEWIISRKKNQRVLPFDDNDIWEEVEIWDLMRTFNTLLSGLSRENVFSIYEEVTVKEKTAFLLELLEDREEFPFLELIVDEHSPLDIICSFLAILEAVKTRMIKIFQHSLFGDILIRRVEEEDYGRDTKGTPEEYPAD